MLYQREGSRERGFSKMFEVQNKHLQHVQSLSYCNYVEQS